MSSSSNNTEFIDHYAVLDVDPSASTSIIRKAYYAKARTMHPDKVRSTDPAEVARATQRFMRLQASFEFLKDDKRRAELDATLQVRRERELARAAESAERRRMREKLERAEAAARQAALVRKRKATADLTRQQNASVLAQMVEEDAQAHAAWKRKRAKTSLGAGAAAAGVLRLVWAKQERARYTEMQVREMMDALGVRGVESMIVRKKKALLSFDSAGAALDAYHRVGGDARFSASLLGSDGQPVDAPVAAPVQSISDEHADELDAMLDSTVDEDEEARILREMMEA